MTLGVAYTVIHVLLRDLETGAPESHYAGHKGQRNEQIQIMGCSAYASFRASHD